MKKTKITNTPNSPKNNKPKASMYGSIVGRHSSKKHHFLRVRIVVAIVVGLVVLGGIILGATLVHLKSEKVDISLSGFTITERNIRDTLEEYGYSSGGGEYSYRVEVLGDEISTYMRQATIVAEDRDFYSSQEPKLSQKLITLMYGEQSEQETRKLAKKLGEMYSLDEIITMYLNEAPYIEGDRTAIYGIAIGSHVYFGKAAEDLTLAEAAFLAVFPSSSTILRPHDEQDQPTIIKRQHEILDGMVDMGYITAEEAEVAKTVDVLSMLRPKLNELKE